MADTNVCTHQDYVTTITDEGANYIFDSISSEQGGTVYSVCANCHTCPSHFIGVPTERLRKTHSNRVIMDPSNPAHVSLLISCPLVPYFLTEDNLMEIHRHSVPSVTGLKEANVINEQGIHVRRQRRKKVRRRDGIVGEYLLLQSTCKLTLEEIDSIKAALRRRNNDLQCYETISSEDNDKSEETNPPKRRNISQLLERLREIRQTNQSVDE